MLVNMLSFRRAFTSLGRAQRRITQRRCHKSGIAAKKEKNMKILFFGDSITDMGRNKELPDGIWTYGSGYPIFVASSLYRENPVKYQVVNRGISGDRVVDLYARVKCDVWNLRPDVLSILIGVNDVWHEISGGNGVELNRFEKVYDMLLADTVAKLPDTKIVLCEPFILKGTQTTGNFDRFQDVYDYAKAVKKLSEKYGAYFLPLQEVFDKAAAKFGAEHYLYDGVHPMVAGATLIADEWIKLFKDKIEK